MMKMKWICYAVCLVSVASAADEVYLKVAGSGQQKTVAVTTNETTCVELFWDGVLSKDGWMSGGHYKITVQRAGEAVVVKELSETAHEGVSSERTNKMTIPAKKIPWTGTISQTTTTACSSMRPVGFTGSASPTLI